MKRTTMFILTFAIVTFITGIANAQFYYWPWAGYQTQCANGRCNRTSKPAQVKSEEPEEPIVAELSLCGIVSELVNKHREKMGLPPFTVDSDLCTGCESHSKWMASGGGFQHSYGIGGRECIAMGVKTPEAVVNMWLNSSGHRAILLGSGRIIGVGFSGGYWTLRVR